MKDIIYLIEEIINALNEGECIDADGNRQLTLGFAGGNPNDGVDFRPIAKQHKNKIANEKRQATRAANKQKKENETYQIANTPVNSLGLDLSKIANNQQELEERKKKAQEEVAKKEIAKGKKVNESDDEPERVKEIPHDADKTLEDVYKNNKATQQAKTEQEDAQINQGLRNKLERIYKKRARKNPFEALSDTEFFELLEGLIYETSVAWKTTKRQKAAQASLPGREKEANEKMKSFNNAVNNMERSLEQSGDVTQSQIRAANQIAKDADRAQSRATAARKVLEESLNLLSILEGDVINFNQKKKEIETQRERDNIANEVNNIMDSGEIRKVRQTSTGNLIGNPETVKKLYGLKDRLKKLCGEE